MNRVFVVSCLSVLGVGAALAAGWSSFSDVFPASPCVDGWAGCRIGSERLSAAPVRDAAGRPIPADARLGWFDLEPTAAFSPFGGLSGYPIDTAPPPAPAPEPVAAAAPVAAAPEVPAAPAAPIAPSQVAPVARPTVAPAVAPAPAPVAVAQPSVRPVAPSAPVATPQPVASVRPPEPVAAPVAAVASKPPPAPPANSKTAPPPAAAPVPPPPPPVAAVSAGDDSCTDLVRLEPAAMMGTLRVGQAKCLDARVASESAQTMKDKVSRLLIVNAETAGNKAEWERYIRRHLEEIDRSDPDLCFKYASHLSKAGVRGAPGTIRWADVALENKARWTGNTFKTRVVGLYRLRAEAANKLWQDAEQAYTQNRTDENEERANKFRGQTKEFAKAWLDYARSSGQDTKGAMTLCASAAGNDTFCKGG